jgi:2-polyprenyl-6-hydroxyphenyl methylase/3-demethylubiquinone-9 3-methyltransferase
MATAVRRFIDWNRRVSRWQRGLIARVEPGCATDGPRDFHEHVLPGLLQPGQRVLDVGGGKNPAISLQRKQDLGLRVVGLDVSEGELLQAPPGAYDAIVVGDVATVSIPGNYDLIFSRSVLEHVAEPRVAVANLAGVLSSGGIMAHVMPCRNAPFAILNRWLGNRTARRLLFAISPEKRDDSGFEAYYRECTPARLSELMRASGLEVINVTPYYRSDYTSFFAPLYTLEMLRQALMSRGGLKNCAESFAIVARAPHRGRAENKPSPPVALP